MGGVKQGAIKIPDSGVILRVREAYERGQTLEALRRAEIFAPLSQWGGAKECVLASRIAANVGAPRLSSRLVVRAYRSAPGDFEAVHQYGFELLGRRGPLAAWWLIRKHTWNGLSAEDEAEWLALQGYVACELRDFANAEALLKRAEEIDPKRAWIRLQRAHLLERLDRIEEALVVTDEALGLHPHPYYRPAVQGKVQLLQLLDRDQDAIQFLQAASLALQNAPLLAQLYALLSENDCWEEAGKALLRFLELAPLLEKPAREWVTGQQARVAYHLGDRIGAAGLAAGLDDEFHREFVERLKEPAPPKQRTQLDVTFVRQHFKTCAPATLAAIGRFWHMPAEHLKLAEAMCYDGTPHHVQREWAQKNGWVVAGFRVTEEIAVQLIERGIPFAISVVDATSAHMMSVIGVDRTRRTLLLRDPSQPYVIEAHAGPFLKRFEAFGPHGTIFIPEAGRARLEGLELPDASLYDKYHDLQVALAAHDRDGAARCLQRMEAAAPAHTLTWQAKLEVAGYDANLTEQSRCLDKLLEQHPRNAARLLQRFACMRDVSREERKRFLSEAIANPQSDAALHIALARTLLDDARNHPAARRSLRLAMRVRPLDATAITAWGDLLWTKGDTTEATELYRFAANLETFREHLYQTWFVACRQTRRSQECLTHLEDRFARFGVRSEQPALTLAWAWRELDQPLKARQVLEQAIQLRPEDGTLRLRAAGLLANLKQPEEARKLLESARGRVRENDLWRTAAEMAENRLDFVESLRCAREVLQREPLALDAHAGVARALAHREGHAAARQHLHQASSAFPHHYGLRRMVVEWSQDAGHDVVEKSLRELLRLEPADAWAGRELTLVLLRQRQPEAALPEARTATSIEPRNSYGFSLLGHVHRNLNQPAEARENFRHAIELSVDNDDAVNGLVHLARTDAERKEALAFIEQELIRQVVTGDGLLTYAELARPVVDAETLLRSLQLAHRERPDLWHAWSALIAQLGHLGRLGEALTLAQQACERFGHLPRIWLDLAQVHRWREAHVEEIKAAGHACEINPGWGMAAMRLANAFERRSQMEDALPVYERALHHAPRDAQLHAMQAHLLWRLRRSKEALAGIEAALRLAPAYEWAWDLLQEWGREEGQASLAAEFARQLARERPGAANAWLMIARVLDAPEAMTERLQSVQRALQLAPRWLEAWDLKAELLAANEQFEQALEACREGEKACLSDVHVLRGRQAWVEAQRRRLPEAVNLMRNVLAENASYSWGWHQLADWYSKQGNLKEATVALEQLGKLRPRDSWVNRQLGFLRLKQKDNASAQRAFAQALQLNPVDHVAAVNLIELQLQTRDAKGAGATLAVMEAHQPGTVTMAMKIKVLLHKDDLAAATDVLAALAAARDPNPWPLNDAADSFREAGRMSSAVRCLKRALKSSDCNPQAAVVLIRLLYQLGKHVQAAWAFYCLPPGEMQRRAAGPLVQLLAEGMNRNIFRLLMWRRRAVFAQQDASWGQVGFAYSKYGLMKPVVAWMSDWRRRPEVEPWMLFNLCLALRHLGHYQEAGEVAKHVVATWGHRAGSADLRLFLAVEDALAGDLKSAREHLQTVAAREDVGYDQQLLALSRALITFQESPLDERRQCFQKLASELDETFGKWPVKSDMKDSRCTIRRAAGVFIRGGAGWRARLWFAWKLYGVQLN